MRLALVPFGALVVLVSTLGTSGCSSPPEAEKEAAKEVLSAANASGATAYASDELTLATEARRSADERLAARKDAHATTRDVTEFDDNATTAANANRTPTKLALEEELNRLERRWKGLGGRVKAAGHNLTKQQRQDWEADSQTGAAILRAAATGLANGNPANAREKLGALTVFMDKWEVVLKSSSVPAGAAKPSMKRETPRGTRPQGSWGLDSGLARRCGGG